MPDWIEDKEEENVTKKQTVLCKNNRVCFGIYFKFSQNRQGYFSTSGVMVIAICNFFVVYTSQNTTFR